MAICQISSNDLGYPCTPELVEAKLKKLDHGREEVFVAVAVVVLLFTVAALLLAMT